MYSYAYELDNILISITNSQAILDCSNKLFIFNNGIFANIQKKKQITLEAIDCVVYLKNETGEIVAKLDWTISTLYQYFETHLTKRNQEYFILTKSSGG
ncbi:hypothetical protein NGC89_02555 [Staphylococcus xylosus]|uniref:hypothetical protein n=1 Tax=Staphylococcus xylosus TaxID=1288 RepID=UPI002DBDBC3E|nr:hypothetical protein [Staphylococcus xylosus]MEB7800347.1 hypothetical protein [Staphylococcus xylosus]